jgi:hypothetical protein
MELFTDINHVQLDLQAIQIIFQMDEFEANLRLDKNSYDREFCLILILW